MKALIFFLAVFTLPFSVFAQELAEYKKAAYADKVIVCDNGSTKLTRYAGRISGKEFVMMALVPSGLYIVVKPELRFFLDGKPAQLLSEEEAAKIIRKASPNYYRLIYREKNDCILVGPGEKKK